MSMLVRSKHKHGHQISCVWHPEPREQYIHTEHLGSIRVQVGPAQYQLNTGEMVSV